MNSCQVSKHRNPNIKRAFWGSFCRKRLRQRAQRALSHPKAALSCRATKTRSRTYKQEKDLHHHRSQRFITCENDGASDVGDHTRPDSFAGQKSPKRIDLPVPQQLLRVLALDAHLAKVSSSLRGKTLNAKEKQQTRREIDEFLTAL